MSRRLVSTRGLLYFFMLMFLVFSFGCSGGGDKAVKYTASGTYSYSDGTITMNWINSDFLCNGPIKGFTNTKTAVTVSTTTLTWSDSNDNDVMTWTRESGTANDPAGTWTTTDLEGNTHTLKIEVTESTSGTMSWSATIHSCAGDFKPGDSAVCGNATCESGENSSNCPDDCGTPLTGGLGNILGDKCVRIRNWDSASNPIWWRGTWVADHSFGWDAVKWEDHSCRHYGGTIFNNIQIKDSTGRIYPVDPYVFFPTKDEYATIVFFNSKVYRCAAWFGQYSGDYPGDIGCVNP